MQETPQKPAPSEPRGLLKRKPTVASAASLLSLMLPGAGQLYGKRYGEGAVFFIAFVACLASPKTIGFCFLIAMLSGLECFRREKDRSELQFNKRYWNYLGVSFVAFVLWFFAVGGEFLFGKNAYAAEVQTSQSVAGPLDLVDVKKVDFTIHINMVFAGTGNVAGKKLLPEARCVVRKPVAVALARVQEMLKLREYSLKMLDCYHPLSLESKFLEWIPKSGYPERYRSEDNPMYRGAAVVATMVQLDGREIPIAAEYDAIPKVRKKGQGRAITGATSKKAAAHLKILQTAMKAEGFLTDPKLPLFFRYNIWEQYLPSDIPFSEIP